MSTPKISKIRWTYSDDKQLAQTARTFNSKITRLINKGFDPSLLPSKIDVKQAKSQVYSRNDFKKIQSDAKRFMKKGAETIIKNRQGEKFTKYELSKTKREHNVRNKRREKAIKERGLDISRDARKIADLGLMPRDLKINPNMGRKSFDLASEAIEKELFDSYKFSSMDNYKQNYFKGIDNKLGVDGEKIKELLKNVDPRKMQELLARDYHNAFIKIPYIYNKDKSKDEIAETVYNEWVQLLDSD